MRTTFQPAADSAAAARSKRATVGSEKSARSGSPVSGSDLAWREGLARRWLVPPSGPRPARRRPRARPCTSTCGAAGRRRRRPRGRRTGRAKAGPSRTLRSSPVSATPRARFFVTRLSSTSRRAAGDVEVSGVELQGQLPHVEPLGHRPRDVGGRAPVVGALAPAPIRRHGDDEPRARRRRLPGAEHDLRARSFDQTEMGPSASTMRVRATSPPVASMVPRRRRRPSSAGSPWPSGFGTTATTRVLGSSVPRKSA